MSTSRRPTGTTRESWLDERDDGRPALRVARGRDDTVRLVQEHVAELLLARPARRRPRRPRGLDERVQLAGLAVHLHAARLDQLVRLAARRDAGAGEEGVQAHERFTIVCPRGARPLQRRRPPGRAARRLRCEPAAGSDPRRDAPISAWRTRARDRQSGLQARRQVRRRLLVGSARQAGSGSSSVTADTLDFVPPWFGQRMQWLSDERAARVSLTGDEAARSSRARPGPDGP